MLRIPALACLLAIATSTAAYAQPHDGPRHDGKSKHGDKHHGPKDGSKFKFKGHGLSISVSCADEPAKVCADIAADFADRMEQIAHEHHGDHGSDKKHHKHDDDDRDDGYDDDDDERERKKHKRDN